MSHIQNTQPFYKCTKCGDVICGNTNNTLRFCSCGSLGVDGNYSSSRILGNWDYIVSEFSTEFTQVFKLKQVDAKGNPTGFYYVGRGKFSRGGKIYTRVPSLKWAPDCVVESFFIVNSQFITNLYEKSNRKSN